MRIALDIDGTITDHLEFFRFLSTALRGHGHWIVIITYRSASARVRTEQELAQWGIVYDELYFVEAFEGKAHLCKLMEIDVFFEDMDECIAPVDERTMVFKVRNGGNFDYEDRKWVSTDGLTRLL
jgi:uncharacterized HAD superfamily protein